MTLCQNVLAANMKKKKYTDKERELIGDTIHKQLEKAHPGYYWMCLMSRHDTISAQEDLIQIYFAIGDLDFNIVQIPKGANTQNTFSEVDKAQIELILSKGF